MPEKRGQNSRISQKIAFLTKIINKILVFKHKKRYFSLTNVDADIKFLFVLKLKIQNMEDF